MHVHRVPVPRIAFSEAMPPAVGTLWILRTGMLLQLILDTHTDAQTLR